MRSTIYQGFVAARAPGIFLAAFFLCLVACTPNDRPARPVTVPSTAVWVEGVFIECSVETNARANRCTIYKDSTGEVLESGLFLLSGGGREATKAELKYAAFGGLVIYLRCARLLSPLRQAQRSTPVAQADFNRPWIVPADLRELLRRSELVVSGTIEDTSPIGVQTVDHIELAASTAYIRVDRVFQGQFAQRLQFTWFTLRCPTSGVFVYSGPPQACFRPQKRYLVFLKTGASGWVVAVPLYAIEIELAPVLPPRALRDLSHANARRRYGAIAQELETAASLAPVPASGSTGEAESYFSATFDLIGGCAEPFYRGLLSSPNDELRSAALEWLEVIRSHHRTCKDNVLRPAKY
jgi:hypothetical protein